MMSYKMSLLKWQRNFIFVLVLSLGTRSERVIEGSADYTLIPGANGHEVVEAVIQKLETSRIFSDDFLFLRRLAYVQSRDGTDLEIDYENFGGIWGLEEEQFNATKSHLLGGQLAAVSRVFRITWADVKWSDLFRPMVSGIAMRLYLDLIFDVIPRDIGAQAFYWLLHFRRGELPDPETPPPLHVYVEAAESHQMNQGCSEQKVDLIFAIDGSGSVGEDNFRRAMSFIENIVEPLKVDPNGARVGLLQYSGAPRIEFYLRQYLSKLSLRRAISRVSYLGGSTRTGRALNAVYERMLRVSRGTRPDLDLVPKILIIVTDGKSHDDVRREAERLHLVGVNVFAVGVTQDVNRDELVTIASGNPSTHVFEINDFSGLELLQNVLQQRSCREPAAWPENQDIVKSIFLPGEKKHLKIKVSEKGITLRLETTNGSLIMFGSTFITNPNEALRHFLLNITNDRVEIFFNPFSEDALHLEPNPAVVSDIGGLSRTILYITVASQTTHPIEATIYQKAGDHTARKDKLSKAQTVAWSSTSPIATTTPRSLLAGLEEPNQLRSDSGSEFSDLFLPPVVSTSEATSKANSPVTTKASTPDEGLQGTTSTIDDITSSAEMSTTYGQVEIETPSDELSSEGQDANGTTSADTTTTITRTGSFEKFSATIESLTTAKVSDKTTSATVTNRTSTEKSTVATGAVERIPATSTSTTTTATEPMNATSIKPKTTTLPRLNTTTLQPTSATTATIQTTRATEPTPPHVCPAQYSNSLKKGDFLPPPFQFENGCFSTTYLVNFAQHRSEESWLKINKAMKCLKAFTACMWVYMAESPEHETTLFQYSLPDEEVEISFTIHSENRFRFKVNKEKTEGNLPSFDPTTWNFFCFSWENAKGRAMIYINRQRASFSRRRISRNLFIKEGGELMLGTEKSSCLNSPDCAQHKGKFVGSISTVNMWSFALADFEMRLASICRKVFGDLISADAHDIISGGDGVKITSRNWCEICPTPPRFF
ncbi:uncharacterized protein LOC143444331 [Clavelina lepadiformis]|uniref:uncharacterized protein LOC143444331 n=1 Tax=Clavelina lepadiformis TaxID=159417 RepID=UPI00404199DB